MWLSLLPVVWQKTTHQPLKVPSSPPGQSPVLAAPCCSRWLGQSRTNPRLLLASGRVSGMVDDRESCRPHHGYNLYSCTHTHTHTHGDTYVCVYVYTVHTSMDTYMYSTQKRTPTHTYIQYIYTHRCTDTHIRTHTHTLSPSMLHYAGDRKSVV